MPQTVIPPAVPEQLTEEALFPEARERRRRRWTIRFGIAGSVCVIGALVIAILAAVGALRDSDGAFVAGAPPVGALTTLHQAGALAVAHDGDLYVVDTPNNAVDPQRQKATRVLVHLPDGRFRLVASGLPYISDIAVAPDGTLYIADAGWVRELGRNGVMRTIAGDGRAPRYDRRTGPLPLASGVRALAAPLGSISSISRYRDSPLQLAVSRSGRLYISDGVQILRLTASGTLEPVRATIVRTRGGQGGQGPGGQLTSIGAIAVAPNGTIYASGLEQGWSLWAIEPNGRARYLVYARQSGGGTVDVQRGPHDTVYAANSSTILQVNPGAPRPLFEFKRHIANQFFWLTDFAVAPDGVIYADEIPGNGGFEAHQQLVAVTGGHVALLWQEKNRAPR